MAAEIVNDVRAPQFQLSSLAAGEGDMQPETADTRSYGERLVTYAKNTSIDEHRFINFQCLQRINIFNLQNELAKQDIAIHQRSTTAEQDMAKLNSTLQQYTSAIRHYEYILRLPSHSPKARYDYLKHLGETFPPIASFTKNPHSYGVSTIEIPHELATNLSTDSLREWLKRTLPSRLTFTQTEKQNRLIAYTYGDEPMGLSPFVDKLARFMVAITGGLSLVVPMLIMRLHENLMKSLITVSVAVVLFSAVTSMVFRATNTETLAATATYAAVLVVFVGTSGSGG